MAPRRVVPLGRSGVSKNDVLRKRTGSCLWLTSRGKKIERHEETKGSPLGIYIQMDKEIER